MKYQSAKSRNILLCVATAIITAVMCVLSVLGAGAAKADGTDSDGGIYYFSDYQGSAAIANEIISSTNRNVVYQYIADCNYADNFVGQFVQNIDFYSIKNAHVIFELRQPFDRQIIVEYDEPYLTSTLEYIFSKLKANRCKIMFICGTDESRFLEYNSFLDYVDIHLSIDMYSDFFRSIFNVVANNGGDAQIEKCTFILDSNIGRPYEDDYTASYFVREYFVTYLVSVYWDNLVNEGKTGRQILDEKKIKIFSQVSDDLYYDFYEKAYVSINDVELMDNDQIYAIGSTVQGEDDTRSWIDDLATFDANSSGHLCVYVYNDPWYEISDITDVELYMATSVNNDEISKIIFEFLLDIDLSPYDNCLGRCVITHKFYTLGSGGGNENMYDWMIDPRENGGVRIFGWSLYYNSEFAAQVACFWDEATED